MTTITAEEFLFASDGLELMGRAWRPSTEPCAILAICHGLNSHGGHYDWPAREAAKDGLAVYALDLRGRGRSEGERFFVARIDDYVADLGRLIDLAVAREGDLPVYLLGHSAGGIVSCIYALEHQDRLSGLICESFAFQVPAPDFALNAIKGLSHIAPRIPVLTLKNEDFTRDPVAVAKLNADPLIAQESQPAQTVAALVRADERLKRDFPLMSLPVLILHGTADNATRPSGSQFFFETTGSIDKTLKLYDNHYHDLLNDIGKEKVIEDILTWIDERLVTQPLPMALSADRHVQAVSTAG